MYKDLAKAKAFKLIEEGATREEVANYLGISRRTVFRWLAARRTLTYIMYAQKGRCGDE